MEEKLQSVFDDCGVHDLVLYSILTHGSDLEPEEGQASSLKNVKYYACTCQGFTESKNLNPDGQGSNAALHLIVKCAIKEIYVLNTCILLNHMKCILISCSFFAQVNITQTLEQLESKVDTTL